MRSRVAALPNVSPRSRTSGCSDQWRDRKCLVFGSLLASGVVHRARQPNRRRDHRAPYALGDQVRRLELAGHQKCPYGHMVDISSAKWTTSKITYSRGCSIPRHALVLCMSDTQPNIRATTDHQTRGDRTTRSIPPAGRAPTRSLTSARRSPLARRWQPALSSSTRPAAGGGGAPDPAAPAPSASSSPREDLPRIATDAPDPLPFIRSICYCCVCQIHN